jgi:hypothetical protein
VEKNHGEKREQCVAESARGHDVAVVRPTEHGHVAGHEAEQKEDAQPDGAAGDGQGKSMAKPRGGNLNGANFRHAAL